MTTIHTTATMMVRTIGRDMLKFICEPCGDAGDLPRKMAELKKTLHTKCRGGTWCDCNHKVRTS